MLAGFVASLTAPMEAKPMTYDFNCRCGCSWDSNNPWLRTDKCYECGEVIEAGEKQQEDEGNEP